MSHWVARTPKRGDQIRVRSKRIVYFHHGVFISPDEVIHFTTDENAGALDWSKARVIKTSLEEFSDGGTVEVKVYDGAERQKIYPVEDIVEYARDCLGETGYNPIFENCEHFAEECVTGEHRSKQVERVGTATKLLFNVVGGRSMGLFSTVLDAISWVGGKIFGSSSSGGRRPAKTEKVKLAEIESKRQARLAEIDANTKLALADKELARTKIERQAQIEFLQAETQARMAEAAQQARFKEQETELQMRLIDKDNERIQIMRDAQVDIIKEQTMSQILIEQARFKGMTALAEKLIALQEKINDMASKRFLIISSARMSAVKDIENYYGEIVAEIDGRRDKYNKEKLPELLEMLAQYEQGTPQYEIYYRQILKDQDIEDEFILRQLDAVSKRQQTVVESTMLSEQKIIEQTGEFALILAKGYAELQSTGLLPSSEASKVKQLPGVNETKKLSGVTHEIKRLPEPAATQSIHAEK